MSSNLFRRPPKNEALPSFARSSSPCGGQCHVTLPLEAFHNFIHEVTRLSRRQGIRVSRGFSRPIDLLRLLLGGGHDQTGAIARVLFLLPRDGALHIGLRYVALEQLSDRSCIFIFASGFAVSGPRQQDDIATRFLFGDGRVRYLKSTDLEDFLAALRRMCEGDLEPVPLSPGMALAEAGMSATDSFPAPGMR